MVQSKSLFKSAPGPIILDFTMYTWTFMVCYCPASVYPFLFWVLLLFIVKDREAWRIAVHGGAKNQTQFSD